MSLQDNGRGSRSETISDPAASPPRAAAPDKSDEERLFAAWVSEVGAEEITLDVAKRNGLGRLKNLTTIGPPPKGLRMRDWIGRIFGRGRYSVRGIGAGNKLLGSFELVLLDIPRKREPPRGWGSLQEMDFDDLLIEDFGAGAGSGSGAPAAAGPPDPNAPNPSDWLNPRYLLGLIDAIQDGQRTHDLELVKSVAQALAKAGTTPDPTPAVAAPARRPRLERLMDRFEDSVMQRMEASLPGAGKVIDVDEDDEGEDDDGEGEGVEDAILKKFGGPVAEAVGEEIAEQFRSRRRARDAARAAEETGVHETPEDAIRAAKAAQAAKAAREAEAAAARPAAGRTRPVAGGNANATRATHRPRT